MTQPLPVLLALACALALSSFAACDDDDEKSTVAPTTTPAPSATVDVFATNIARLPTLAPRATQTPLPDPATLRVCEAGELSAAFVGSNGASGQVFYSFGIGNKSETPCQITSRPDISFRDATGNVVPWRLLWGQPCPRQPFCVSDGPIGLGPGLGNLSVTNRPDGRLLFPAQAVMTLVFSSHDGAGFCEPPPLQAAGVRLLMADGDELVVDMSGHKITSCSGDIRVWIYRPVE
jgi:hypothetical protein